MFTKTPIRPLSWGGLVGLVLALLLASSVRAAPPRQVPIYTSTPGPDGRIVYTVKASDTLLSISLLTGVSVDELREMNDLTGDNIVEGQSLVIGFVTPEAIDSTPGPSPAPTDEAPTPTVEPGTGKLCILLYHDEDGDTIRAETEVSIPGGRISVSNRAGTVSLTGETTDSLDPVCFEPISEGDYNISVGIPDGYNPTTAINTALQLQPGDATFLEFGAQPNSETLAEAPIEAGGSGRSPLLGIIGGMLLVGGVGLGLFAGRLLKGK